MTYIFCLFFWLTPAPPTMPSFVQTEMDRVDQLLAKAETELRGSCPAVQNPDPHSGSEPIHITAECEAFRRNFAKGRVVIEEAMRRCMRAKQLAEKDGKIDAKAFSQWRQSYIKRLRAIGLVVWPKLPVSSFIEEDGQ